MSRRYACQREEATVHASESGSNVGALLLLCDVGARRAAVAKRSLWTIRASRSKFAPSATRTAGEPRHTNQQNIARKGGGGRQGKKRCEKAFTATATTAFGRRPAFFLPCSPTSSRPTSAITITGARSC